MHEDVLEVALKRTLVWHGGKSSKSFLMDKYSQRTDSIDHHINSHVEFESINQHGFVHVPLHNIAICLSNA
jgi:hypothetical protein